MTPADAKVLVDYLSRQWLPEAIRPAFLKLQQEALAHGEVPTTEYGHGWTAPSVVSLILDEPTEDNPWAV